MNLKEAKPTRQAHWQLFQKEFAVVQNETTLLARASSVALCVYPIVRLVFS